MNYKTLVQGARAKQRIKRLDKKIEERLEEMEKEKRIKKIEKEYDFVDSTFIVVQIVTRIFIIGHN